MEKNVLEMDEEAQSLMEKYVKLEKEFRELTDEEEMTPLDLFKSILKGEIEELSLLVDRVKERKLLGMKPDEYLEFKFGERADHLKKVIKVV